MPIYMYRENFSFAPVDILPSEVVKEEIISWVQTMLSDDFWDNPACIVIYCSGHPQGILVKGDVLISGIS